ncbi:MAG: hypothetical protein WCH10_05265 [bacterium]
MNKPRIFSRLEEVVHLNFCPMFWINTNGILLGHNKTSLQFLGVLSKLEPNESVLLMGKHVRDVCPEKVANILLSDMRFMIKEVKVCGREEIVEDVKTKEMVRYLSKRIPLFDDKKINIIGMLCESMKY